MTFKSAQLPEQWLRCFCAAIFSLKQP